MATTMIYTTKPCMSCEQRSTIELDPVAVANWRDGVHVQVAFPDLSDEQRELLISGTHPACWDAMFPEEE